MWTGICLLMCAYLLIGVGFALGTPISDYREVVTRKDLSGFWVGAIGVMSLAGTWPYWAWRWQR
jgi:hypothetical protein